MNTKAKNNLFAKLAFHQAEINLGSTGKNPSVGCVIEKNGAVISSGLTSFNGRPHAEYNALKRKNFLIIQICILLLNLALIRVLRLPALK